MQGAWGQRPRVCGCGRQGWREEQVRTASGPEATASGGAVGGEPARERAAGGFCTQTMRSPRALPHLRTQRGSTCHTGSLLAGTHLVPALSVSGPSQAGITAMSDGVWATRSQPRAVAQTVLCTRLPQLNCELEKEQLQRGADLASDFVLNLPPGSVPP